MALQTATNPQTGERIVLINGQWVPFAQSATNNQGQKAFLVNNQWVYDQSAVAKPEPEEESGFLRQVADVPLGLAKGAVSGVRMVADAFGANSPVSQTIKGAEDYLAGLMSAESRKDSQEIARIMQDAEDKGMGEQVKAALQAFMTAPVDLLAQGLGTAAPVVLSTLGAKVLGAGALATKGIGLGLGAGMGAGVTKGTIYEETKQALTEAGMPEEQAEARAQLAQSYGGQNLDMILAGTALGGLASTTGIEKALAGPLARGILARAGAAEGAEQAAKRGVEQVVAGPGFRRTVSSAASRTAPIITGALAESVPEILQAGQEQLAANIALQREGFDVDTMRGVVGAAALEGLVGAGLGAGVGAIPSGTTAQQPPAPPREEPLPETPEAPIPPVAPAAPEAGVSTFTPERAFTVDDIDAAGVDFPRGFLPFVRRNILGKTRSQLQAEVEANPELIEGESPSARLIRSLLQPQPAADQSGVGLPVQQPAGSPTGIGAPQPGAVDGAGRIAQPPVVPQAPVTPTVTETPRGTTTPQAIEAEAQGQEDADAEPFPDIELPATPEESWNQMSQETRLKAAEQAGIANPKNLANKNWGALSKNMRGRLEKTIASQQAVPFEEAAPRQAQPRRPSEPKAPTIPPAENPQNIGALPGTTWEPGTTPETSLVSEGAVPFRNKTEARAARRLQPDMRVIKVPGGFVLSPKTEAQMEADRKAGERLGRARVGEAGRPLNAMQFIVDAGGLNRSAANNVPGVDPGRNLRVGNRFLVTQNGMSLDKAAELLKQNGYIDEESEAAAANALGNPNSYTPEGFNRLIEIEQAERDAEDAEIARMEDEEMAQWADFVEDPDSYLNTGFEEALEEVKAEVWEILSRVEELNIDPEEIYENANARARERAQRGRRESVTDEDYFLSAREELRDVLSRSPEDRRSRDGQPRQEVPDLELTPPTPETQAEAESRAAEAEKAEQEATKEADKAKAAETRERERKEIAERSKGAADDFQLGQTAEQNLTGQKDILFSTDSQISTNEEKQEALAQFRDRLSLKAPTFRHRGGSGSGRIVTTRPRKLTKAQVDEIVGLASDAIDLGMPASILSGINAAGSASIASNAAITQPDGHLLLGRPWASMTRQKKLQTFIHEIGHQADYQNTEAPMFSGDAKWEAAYEELKNWYDSDARDRKKAAPNIPLSKHPLTYPFAPGFRGSVRLRQEAFAQAFAYYLTDPVLLQSNAPIAYGQIQSILEGIQNESQPTSRTSKAARKAAEGKVQPAGTQGAAGVRPQDAEIVSGGRQAADGGQRGGAPVKGERKSKAEKEAEQEAIDKQEANIPSIWGGTIKPSFVVDNEVNWFERYIMQPLVNRNYDVRNVYNSIRKAAIEIPKRFDIKELEITSSGMEGEMERQFVQEEVLPIQKEMIAKNIESEDIHNYMLALHAEERNRDVARRNPKYPDGGSGMTNQEARDYLASLSPERRKDLQDIKQKLDAIQNGTRELIVETGQEKASTVEAWTKNFKNYVPLFREEMDYDDNISPGQGTGISVRGDFSRSFTGSSKPVQDVFASIVAQRQRAIARGMKMRQGRGLFGLALTAPAPNFWMAVDPRSTKMEQVKRYQEELAMIRGELAGGVADPVRQEKLEDRVGLLEDRIERLKPQAEADLKNLIDGLVDFGLSGEEISNLMAQPFEAVYSPTSGMVEYKPNRLLKSPYVIATRINGEEVYVFFNKNNERARRMAEQLHNMGTEPMDIFNRILAPITRYFAAINTQYNPIWGAYNFLRDSQGAAIQASGTIIEDSRAKVVYDGFRMMLPIAKMLRDERKGKVSNSEVAVAFRELREQGGTTGFKDNFSRQEDRLEALTDQMKQVREGKLKSIVRNDVFGLVSDFNTSLENTIRLAAYMEAKRKYTEQYMKEGLSREAAEIRAKQPSAVVAKGITVNFNQKGGLGTKIGSLYAFFNAAVQGTVRAAETLFTWDKPGDFKSIRPTPFGKKFIGGALLWGVMQPVLLAMFGIDPDDLEEYQKERNFIIPLGDGKMFFFPMPFVFSAIPNTSRIMTEWYMGGMKDAGKYVTNLGGAYLNAFNPLGGSIAVQTFTPTPFKPIIALAQNEDAFGRKIAREAFNESQQIPGYQMAKDSASAFGKVVSEFINYTTGGTKDVAGAISPTPDQVDYFVGQLTGGVGREILKASQVIESPFTGEKVPFYKYPLIGRFGADVNEGGAIAGKFYGNLTKLNAYENTIKGMRQRKEPLGEYLNENPQARLYNQANIVERDIQKLRKTMREAKERGDKERVQLIQDQIQRRMELFNKRVEEAEK